MAAALPALLAAASAEEAGGGLANVNLGLTIWTIVLFALFAAVLSKFGWGPLLRAIEEREKGIRDAVEGAQKAHDEAQALVAQHKEAGPFLLHTPALHELADLGTHRRDHGEQVEDEEDDQRPDRDGPEAGGDRLVAFHRAHPLAEPAGPR